MKYLPSFIFLLGTAISIFLAFVVLQLAGLAQMDLMEILPYVLPYIVSGTASVYGLVISMQKKNINSSKRRILLGLIILPFSFTIIAILFG